MSKKNLIFGDEMVNKNIFTKNKQLIDTNNADINKIEISNKSLYGEEGALKYFIECKNNVVIKQLYINLPQIIGYVRHFKYGNKNMFFINSN